MPKLPACLLLLSTLAFTPASRAAESPSPAGADATRTAANPRYTGSPFVTTWTAEDYGGAPINWNIVFNPVNGFVYVGNNYGVLEFDGATWRLIELPDQSPVHALAVDADGRVWAGGASDLCLLAPDATGALHAVSQRNRLPAAQRVVGEIFHGIAASQGVYFASAATLYFFGRDGSVRTWPAQPRISEIWWAGEELYALMSDGRVFRLREGVLEAVEVGEPAGEPASVLRKRSFAARSSERAGSLLLTGYGPAQWAGPGAPLVPLSREAATLFRTEQTLAAIFLADGRIAYGTVRSGLFVFDAAGRLVQHLTRADGLPGNRIEHMAEDAEGGLWLATHTGLARVQIDSPFAVHGLAQGVDGSPRALLRLGERLFLTHSEGVAWRGSDGRFVDFTGTRVGMNKLFVLDDQIFATGPTLRELRADGEAPVRLRRPYSPMLRWPREPHRVIAGGTDGLALLTQLSEAALHEDGLVEHAPSGIRELLDSNDGWVWGTTVDGRIWRADFRSGLRLDAPVEIFDATRGLPPVRHRDDPKIFLVDGAVVAMSAAWVRRFDAASGRFGPDGRFGDPALATGALAAQMDDHGELWLRAPPPAADFFRLAPTGAPPWHATPLPSAPLAALVVNDLYHDEALHTLWISGQGALVSLDLDWRPVKPAPLLHALVRRVATADGAVLALTDTRLEPGQNSLHFDFGAPTYTPDYRGKLLTVYRTRLDGVDADWTAWSPESHRDFPRLPYRALTFHVQARSPDGRNSAPDEPESQFAFVIAPPWWLTRWAYAGYATFAGLGIVGIVKLRTRGLRRRAAWLESEIAAHTVELHARNQELARLHQLELDEKTSAKIGEQRALIAEEQARLEMLRYQLNPHFLFNALASISGLAVARPTAARDMIGKLSEFCRRSLARGRDDTATLADEFEMLRLYLDVEKARWEEGLQIDFLLDPAVRDVRLPAFLLLPLVENAVKYGSQTSPDILCVSVSARRGASGRLEIEVANTGAWVTDGATTARSTHIGLANLRERLARAFPGRHEFTSESADGWVRVRLQLQI